LTVLLRSKLVGRSREIAELDDEYRKAVAGEFRVVLLAGDPGLGKTRLAREFLTRKADRALGLAARGYPLGTTASFGIWAEALERHLRTLAKSDVVALCGGFLDDLASLFRSVAAVKGDAPGHEPSRLRLLGGLAILISNLTRQSPVILLIDDAHDADPSSWEALAYLAGDLSNARVLVVAAVRPNELADNQVATEAIGRLEQDGVLRRRELKALDPKMLGQLAESALGAAPSDALVGWLAARSRGNPLFALGLLQALLDEGADLSAPGLQAIPEQLAERVIAGMKKLDALAIDLAETLAVIARRVDLRDLAQLSDGPREELAGTLERLVRSRLVFEDTQGLEISYEIAHPLVQQAIYQQIGAARRRHVHRRIARTLLVAGGVSEAASHFARSATVGDDEAISAVRDAVREAEAHEAYREALTGLNALVELIPAGDPCWLDVLKALCWRAEWVTDHRADTHAVLGVQAMKAIDLLLERSPDQVARAMVKFRLANFLGWGTGDLEEAEEACGHARSLFENAGDAASALLASNELSWLRGLRGDYAAMEKAANAVAERADAFNAPFVRIQAFQAAGFAAMVRGRFLEAENAHRLGAAIAGRENKGYRLTVGLMGLGVVAAVRGRIEEAAALLEQAKQLNPGWRESILPEWESIVRWFAGDFPGALACADDAASHAVGELSKRRALGVIFAALAAAETADGAQARRHLARAVRAYEGRDWQFFSHCCGHAQGLLEWQEGRLAEASSRLRTTATSILATGARPFAALVLIDLADLAAQRRDVEICSECRQQLSIIAAEIDCDVYHAIREIGSACEGYAAGGGDSGAGAADRATRLLADSRCRFFHARAFEGLGRSLAASDPAGAVTALGRAASLYDGCGALWRRDRTRALLRSFGSRGRRTAARLLGPATLSRRERQVAELAAQGLMGVEIGDRLSISERTVETHLANVYSKLGVRSKIDLVRRAAEFGLNQ
jgi:DNA-binding CsgD family transcriptional regulator/tetratricopeptide (TPR) repeat protein